MWIESSDEAGRLGVLRHSANRRISQDQQRATFQLVPHTRLQGFLIPVRRDKLRPWQFEILRRIGEDRCRTAESRQAANRGYVSWSPRERGLGFEIFDRRDWRYPDGSARALWLFETT